MQGDLGESWFTGIAVTDTIATDCRSACPSRAWHWCSRWCRRGRRSPRCGASRQRDDTAVTLAASTLATLPPFVVSILLILVFGVAVPILPTGGYITLAQDPAGWLACIILPAIALSLEAAADIARQLRTALVATLRRELHAARGCAGTPTRVILLRHALPHAAGPALSVVGIQVPRLVGGAIIAEQIFSLPGLGLDGIRRRDAGGHAGGARRGDGDRRRQCWRAPS